MGHAPYLSAQREPLTGVFSSCVIALRLERDRGRDPAQAQSLGIVCVAIGIEEPEQLVQLLDSLDGLIGCKQGFGIS